jgi:hypothetical protein
MSIEIFELKNKIHQGQCKERWYENPFFVLAIVIRSELAFHSSEGDSINDIIYPPE